MRCTPLPMCPTHYSSQSTVFTLQERGVGRREERRGEENGGDEREVTEERKEKGCGGRGGEQMERARGVEEMGIDFRRRR